MINRASINRKVEYIWVDGTKPTPQLRSKTKMLSPKEGIPIWGFDGSSTNQAEGSDSDCVLSPVFVCNDPIRGYPNELALCEVLNTDMTPHKSNTRASLSKVYEKHKPEDMWFGMEQEYTFMNWWDYRPYGFDYCRWIKEETTSEGQAPFKPLPQGPYYCSVGSGLAIGRKVAEEHLDACLEAGLTLSGINAEVMPGQWEFQIGPVDAMEVSDQLWVARWLLHRVAEKYEIAVSFDPKPAEGDWNGAGCHTNFSTKEMRNSLEACERAATALGKRATKHIENYGAGIEKRLTGDHETCSYNEYKWGVSDRGASVRIPWQVAKEGKGYIEDRRPNANCDPYVVTRLITETVCGSNELYDTYFKS
jgi:glutamine synthetase